MRELKMSVMIQGKAGTGQENGMMLKKDAIFLPILQLIDFRHILIKRAVAVLIIVKYSDT